MFSDLSGYTALNEALDPEEVEAVMGRIKADATAIVERHGGTVNQFVGDEIMALFGVPLAHRDDARRAVSAAFALHRAVDAFVATLGPAHARALAMHTGINAGLVVARKSDARAGNFALTGDAVNTAARLRSLAGPGEIVVSAETWRQVADFFDADEGVPTEVKGKEQPLVAVRVRGERAGAERGAAARWSAATRSCATSAPSPRRAPRGSAAGSSSSAATRASASRGWSPSSSPRRARSASPATPPRCSTSAPRPAATPCAAWRAACSASATPPTSSARREALAQANAARPIAAERRLFLHDLLDVAPPVELRALAAAMSTAAREKGSLDALCELATGASGAGPLLLVVEDIHWADAWTLERLAALAVLAARQPLLLVMTTRFAGDPSAGAWRTTLHGAPLIGIDLGPLNGDESLQLAAQASTMTPALLASCVERAEGNPLFLLQLLLNAGEAAQSSLPGSIQALVHTRMDRLAPRDKLALQAAAVFGQRFTVEALRHLIEEPAYDGRLLVENFLVRADGSELMFCHALIRDGAYGSLLHKRRRALHARAAEWFLSRDLVLAAEHFDRADDPRAAAAYLAASDAVATQYRHAVALELAERGLALATEQATRFALLMARGRLLVELGRSGDAIEASRAALAVAADDGERAQALVATAAGMRLNDRIAEGLAALDEAEPLAVAASRSLDLSRLHHLRGNLLFPLGRHAGVPARARPGARPRPGGGSLEAEAAAIGGLGDAYYLQGRMRSANQQFRECVALARAQGFGRLEVANLSMVGWSSLHLNEIASRRGRRSRGDRARAARLATARRGHGTNAGRLGRRRDPRPRRCRAAERRRRWS